MEKKFYAMLVWFLNMQLYSQSLNPTIINSAGGSNSVNGIQYEWSFGEMTLINTFSTSKLIITQGVLQTRMDTTGVGIRDTPCKIPDITAYPNPAQNSISLQAAYPVSGKLQYELTDMNGKVIRCKEQLVYIGNDEQTIDVSDLHSGVYLLKLTITQSDRTFFKVIKIQKAD